MEKAPPVMHEFDPEIYPVRLWVCISNDMKVLNKWFVNATNGNELNTMHKANGAAVTQYVINKESGNYGAVILILSRKLLGYETVAHESSHAASIIWRHIGESEWGEEANAYLIGWIAQCIEQTKNHKAT